MLAGSTEGIETIYKNVMRMKREIPASSCPSDIENILYATGVSADTISREEWSAFKSMLEQLDTTAELYEAKKPAKHTRSLYSKKIKKNIHGEWYRVDTEGKFWVGDNQYIIDSNAAQYAPIETDYGDYYAMDKILCAGGKFYDMNYDEVMVYPCGGIVPYESVVWTEM